MISIQTLVISRRPESMPTIRQDEVDDLPAILVKYAIDTRTPVVVNVVRDRRNQTSNIVLDVKLDDSAAELFQILDEYREPRVWSTLNMGYLGACEIADEFVRAEAAEHPGLIISLSRSVCTALTAAAA